MIKHARLLICIATAATVAGGGAGTANAASNVAGNPQAIAFARSVRSAYNHVGGISYTQTGYAGLRSAIGQHSFFDVTWGNGYLPSGWVNATEHAVVALHKGAVVWAKDVMLPPRCTAVLGCASEPVEIVETKRGSFWRFAVSGPQFNCFSKLSGEGLSFPIGSSWISVGGDYSPLVVHGTTVTSHFTYIWGSHQTAAETDTVSATTKLISAYRVRVSRGQGREQPAFSFGASYTNLTKTPAQPKITLCT